MKVVIDPGHGGRSPGAVWEGIFEKDIALAISLELQRALHDQGAQTRMTRISDKGMSLEARANLANRWRADVFVSVHLNSCHFAIAHKAKGVETLYYEGSPEGERIAGNVQRELLANLPEEHNDRGIKPRGDLTVLMRTQMPAVLVECEFLSHPEMRAYVQDPLWQAACAEGIAAGLVL